MDLTPILGFLKNIFIYMVPFVLASQGTMLTGRTGLFSVAQEGTMLFGSAIGFLVSFSSGNQLLGMAAAVVCGGIFGLALAYFTTTLKMDQFVIGLALFFVGFGLHTLIPKLALGTMFVSGAAGIVFAVFGAENLPSLILQ